MHSSNNHLNSFTGVNKCWFPKKTITPSSILLFLLLTLILISASTMAQDSPVLMISKEDNGYRLDWVPQQGQDRWAVLRSSDPKMMNPDTLAITSSYTWLDYAEDINFHGQWFYRVVPWINTAPPNDYVVIEDFEDGEVDLESYPDEDIEPNTVDVVEGGYRDSEYCLGMVGDSWKIQYLDPIELDQSDIWSVDLYLSVLGRMQMIGVGDGEDEMFYVIWGEDAPNTDPWITTYQGWFPEEEWVTIYLPVGEDWHGRFGSNGTIDRIFYVNENEGIWPRGELLVDNLRNVTNAMPLNPTSAFRWTWGNEVAGDSIEVVFNNLTIDGDSGDLDFFWSFGDGNTSQEEHPTHRYPRGGRWPVTLRTVDSQRNWDIYTAAVVDSPLTLQSDFTISCVGDIILARGYSAEDGLIDTYGVDYLFEQVEPYISAADIAICNLESPQTDAETVHPTKTIWFKGREEDTIGIANAGFDYASVANNHIIDYMVEGMHDTQNILEDIGVLWGGAGDNDIEARMPTYLSNGGKSLAVISMCNRTGHYNNYQPFLDSGRNRPGFALWNRSAIEATVPAARENADLVMTYVHCGSEYSRFPMDGDKLGHYLVDEVEQDDDYVTFELHPDSGEVALRHYAIDMGADLVVCHHPHVIQGVEVYNGKLIVHSLGNFIFDLSMNETMPTMIAEMHVGADSVDGAIIRPGWIEEWIPTVINGGFAHAVLDYLSHYSLLLNTHLVRLPGEDIAHVMWDQNYPRGSQVFNETHSMSYVTDTEYRTRPIKLTDEGGHVARIEALPNGGGDVEIRYGRDILLWANMEDEGAQPWNLNSDFEYYDTEHVYEGERSVKLNVPDNAGDNYVTLFERRVRIYPENDHSFLGWMYTTNANNAEFQVRFYQDRGDGNFNLQAIPASLSGDNDWTPVYADFDSLEWFNRYINIRLSEYPADEDWAEAWYDDMSFIWWEGWQTVDLQDGVDVPFPSGYRFAQIRTTAESESVDIEWTNEWPDVPDLWPGVVDENFVAQ